MNPPPEANPAVQPSKSTRPLSASILDSLETGTRRQAQAELSAPARVAAGLYRSANPVGAPHCSTFKNFLSCHARILERSGAAGPFSLEGRAPLELAVDWLDKILLNTIGDPGPVCDDREKSAGLPDPPRSGEVAQLSPKTVEIDGVVFPPGTLKGATLAIAGGAQFGKTVLELNLMAYVTAIRFLNAGNYLPDRPKVEEIVGQKFRPNVLDLYPWMAGMIQLGKVQNASGKTIDRKESYTVTDGRRKAFGSFCGMHKPPTSITLDIALLDEVDDIDDRNVGYVDARMTSSPVALTCFIGTQRVCGAGQNRRLQLSSFHVRLVPCPACGREWCLEEEFPRCVRVRRPPSSNPNPRPACGGSPQEPRAASGPLSQTAGTFPGLGRACSPGEPDPIITAEMGFDRLARYYVACVECGTPLDRAAGRYVARHPDRIPEARFGVRVSQLNIAAISLEEIVGAWYAAFEDPSGCAMAAFACDRAGVPHAGAAQPLTQAILDEARRLGLSQTADPAPYAMSVAPRLAEATAGNPPLRVAGMDMGPRCWFWCDEVAGPAVSACVWAELIASGNASDRLPLLVASLGIQCVLLDAGGEPDLTKRLVMALNGLENYRPPALSRTEILGQRLLNLGAGLAWDGERRRWRGLRSAAVLFVPGSGQGLEHTIGFTQDGRIYPLLKCQRYESIQSAVNDFLTPAQGVVELMNFPRARAEASESQNGQDKVVRSLPRARLPRTVSGAGVSLPLLDSHLLNLRKVRHPRTGLEDWIEGVENHLGLAKTYARLAQIVVAGAKSPRPGALRNLDGIRYGGNDGSPFQPFRWKP